MESKLFETDVFWVVVLLSAMCVKLVYRDAFCTKTNVKSNLDCVLITMLFAKFYSLFKPRKQWTNPAFARPNSKDSWCKYKQIAQDKQREQSFLSKRIKYTNKPNDTHTRTYVLMYNKWHFFHFHANLAWNGFKS